ncbi:hypothetical protein EWI31_18750, partial [Streptomyces tsukubensis]
STNLALIFGTLLSSQGTDASFRPFSPGPPGFSLRSCVSNLTRSFSRSVSGPEFRIQRPVEAAFCLSTLPFGGADFIRSISAELIGLRDPDKESVGSAGSSFPSRASQRLTAALGCVQSEATV